MAKHHHNVELDMDFIFKWKTFPTQKIKVDRFQVSTSMQQQSKTRNYIWLKTSED